MDEYNLQFRTTLFNYYISLLTKKWQPNLLINFPILNHNARFRNQTSILRVTETLNCVLHKNCTITWIFPDVLKTNVSFSVVKKCIGIFIVEVLVNIDPNVGRHFDHNFLNSSIVYQTQLLSFLAFNWKFFNNLFFYSQDCHCNYYNCNYRTVIVTIGLLL